MRKSANYTVLITQEKRTGTQEPCYVAKVPTLDIATEADTKEAAEQAAKELIAFHLECLAQEHEEVPVENSPTLTTITTLLPKNAQVAAN